MHDIALKVEGLGKRYRLGRRRNEAMLRDLIQNGFSRLFRPKSAPSVQDDWIWALKNVSFEIKKGEVVGIIGRNGAGKSTLLKILSRITDPTEGNAEIYGRVSSLLEVGTGFHAELTGRENIYLSAAILGMRKKEIARKFDEIVAFSEVEKFIDTPVKHFSSGMYLRLAFSVAAHLDPDILVIDEILAVGDITFQKKCIGKMEDVTRKGRTVLFVSHNMAVINRLCGRAILLANGSVAKQGKTDEVLGSYFSETERASAEGRREWAPEIAPGDEFARLLSVELTDASGKQQKIFYQDTAFRIRITYQVLKTMTNANFGFKLHASDGTLIFTSYDADHPKLAGQGRAPGVYTAECLMPANLLNEGAYYLSVEAGIPFLRLCLNEPDILKFRVQGPICNDGPVGRNGIARPGLILPDLEWKLEKK